MLHSAFDQILSFVKDYTHKKRKAKKGSKQAAGFAQEAAACVVHACVHNMTVVTFRVCSSP